MSSLFLNKTLFLLIFAMFISSAYANNLPNLGEGASVYLNHNEAKKIGLKYYRKLIRSPSYIDDEIVNDYVQNLTNKITNVAGFGDFEFKTLVVKSPNLNAFALPGGYIVLNTALIKKCDNESQLASVIAHEIAHITQNHHARLFKKSSKNNLKMLGAILAAIILADSNPNAAGATMYAGLAGSTQNILNNTRAHEIEADSFGIKFLAKAGFNPYGMVEFFDKLPKDGNDDGVYQGIGQFLSTHPLSLNRMSAAKSYVDEVSDISQKTDSLNFQIIKLKISKKLNDYYFKKIPAKYKKHIVNLNLLIKKDKNINYSLFKKTNNKYSKIIYYDYLSKTNLKNAIAGYDRLFLLYPHNKSIASSFIKMLYDNKKYQEIIKFIESNSLYLPQSLPPVSLYKLSYAYHKIDDKINGKLQLVSYYNKLGLKDTAKIHLIDLKNNFKLSTRQKAQVSALLDE
ncbi:MAG: hypothetical protein DRQ51_08100 [Gammaproteobacteria bacterium]|nr:MAG: hypothetical protein DRQ51_08100 [Gammaproteobacteria bacterium]